MYNEVYKSCPKCGQRCEIQISQIVLGFGHFNLDDTDDLSERLTEKQLRELRDAVWHEKFYCNRDREGCGSCFMLGDQDQRRKELAKELFSGNGNCPCCNYPNCDHEHPVD